MFYPLLNVLTHLELHCSVLKVTAGWASANHYHTHCLVLRLGCASTLCVSYLVLRLWCECPKNSQAECHRVRSDSQPKEKIVPNETMSTHRHLWRQQKNILSHPCFVPLRRLNPRLVPLFSVTLEDELLEGFLSKSWGSYTITIPLSTTPDLCMSWGSCDHMTLRLP